jgi:hypothetical protein
MVSKGNHPQMALIQVSELLQFTQMSCEGFQQPHALYHMWHNPIAFNQGISAPHFRDFLVFQMADRILMSFQSLSNPYATADE